METETSSEQQSVWEMDASSAWSWIKTSIATRCRKLLTGNRSWPGAKPSETSQDSSWQSESLLGKELLQAYRQKSLARAIAEQQALLQAQLTDRTLMNGLGQTSRPQVLIWSEREQAFVRPKNDTPSGQL